MPQAQAQPATFRCPQRLTSGVGDSWRGDQTCSYCGSVSPDYFLSAVERGAEVVPTDKNYKVYLEEEVGNVKKFYLAHMDQAQRVQFLELHNTAKMKIGHPGYFYVMPFFVRRKDV